jgi:sugar lactone lactonase YvrE
VASVDVVGVPRMRVVAIVLAGALWLGTSTADAHPVTIGAAAPFASGLVGPEGLAFGKDGTLYVGTADGQIRKVASDGSHTLLANVGDRFAGISVLKDGRILACAFGANRVWSIDPVSGAASVYANVDSPNFVMQTRRGHVLVSSSFPGNIVDVTNGANVVLASGLSFPNGLAVRKRQLYVAETFANRVSRLPFTTSGSLGAPEVYAGGMGFADGIAFDRPGNLFVVGVDQLFIVDVLTQAVTVAPADPLYDWPSNIAFGRTTLLGKDVMYLANFGPMLGDGTTIIKVPTNHRGANLIR